MNIQKNLSKRDANSYVVDGNLSKLKECIKNNVYPSKYVLYGLNYSKKWNLEIIKFLHEKMGYEILDVDIHEIIKSNQIELFKYYLIKNIIDKNKTSLALIYFINSEFMDCFTDLKPQSKYDIGWMLSHEEYHPVVEKLLEKTDYSGDSDFFI